MPISRTHRARQSSLITSELELGPADESIPSSPSCGVRKRESKTVAKRDNSDLQEPQEEDNPKKKQTSTHGWSSSPKQSREEEPGSTQIPPGYEPASVHQQPRNHSVSPPQIPSSVFRSTSPASCVRGALGSFSEGRGSGGETDELPDFTPTGNEVEGDFLPDTLPDTLPPGAVVFDNQTSDNLIPDQNVASSLVQATIPTQIVDVPGIPPLDDLSFLDSPTSDDQSQSEYQPALSKKKPNNPKTAEKRLIHAQENKTKEVPLSSSESPRESRRIVDLLKSSGNDQTMLSAMEKKRPTRSVKKLKAKSPFLDSSPKKRPAKSKTTKATAATNKVSNASVMEMNTTAAWDPYELEVSDPGLNPKTQPVKSKRGPKMSGVAPKPRAAPKKGGRPARPRTTRQKKAVQRNVSLEPVQPPGKAALTKPEEQEKSEQMEDHDDSNLYDGFVIAKDRTLDMGKMNKTKLPVRKEQKTRPRVYGSGKSNPKRLDQKFPLAEQPMNQLPTAYDGSSEISDPFMSKPAATATTALPDAEQRPITLDQELVKSELKRRVEAKEEDLPPTKKVKVVNLQEEPRQNINLEIPFCLGAADTCEANNTRPALQEPEANIVVTHGNNKPRLPQILAVQQDEEEMLKSPPDSPRKAPLPFAIAAHDGNIQGQAPPCVPLIAQSRPPPPQKSSITLELQARNISKSFQPLHDPPRRLPQQTGLLPGLTYSENRPSPWRHLSQARFQKDSFPIRAQASSMHIPDAVDIPVCPNSKASGGHAPGDLLNHRKAESREGRGTSRSMPRGRPISNDEPTSSQDGNVDEAKRNLLYDLHGLSNRLIAHLASAETGIDGIVEDYQYHGKETCEMILDKQGQELTAFHNQSSRICSQVLGIYKGPAKVMAKIRADMSEDISVLHRKIREEKLRGQKLKEMVNPL